MSFKRDKVTEIRHLVNYMFRKTVISTVFTTHMPEDLLQIVTKNCLNKFGYFESYDYFNNILTISDITKTFYTSTASNK